MVSATDHGPEPCSIPFGALVPGTFVRRDNRFRVQVQIGRRRVAAHLPNSGRLGELLVPGHDVWLTPAAPAALSRRLTAYDLTLVQYAGRLVSVDARLPADLVAEALRCGWLSGFQRHPVVKREVRLGQSRIDFWLGGTDDTGVPPCWIEVKSVTLVTEGTARFPDAPTARGRRHVQELVRAVERGHRAAVMFVVQRDDALRFAPHDAADPAFGDALRRAGQAGVEILALRGRVTLQSIQLLGPIPVLLG